jgi:FkbM family methyltransferase
MDGSASEAWYRQKPVLIQLPWRMRAVGAYCRLMWRLQPAAKRRRGHILGASYLQRSMGEVRSRLGKSNEHELVVNGMTVFCDLGDTRFVHVVAELSQLTSDRRILTQLLRPGSCFVDIGANHGSFGLSAAAIVGPTGTVIAVEPQPLLAKLVEKSLRISPAGRAVVHQVAVGSEPGTVDLYVPRGQGGSATLHAEAVAESELRQISVPMETVDRLLAHAKIEGPLVMKIDVEGHELSALEGATETLRRHRPPIILELNPHTAHAAGHSIADLVEFLALQGYRIAEYATYPEAQAPDDVDLTRMRNVVAVPA